MIKYILIWVPMIFIAIINGAARDFVYKNYVGELAAGQISTISLIILFGIYLSLMLKRYPLQSALEACAVGLLWVILTLIFEFSMGRMAGHSWDFLFAEYNIAKGRIWILVPLFLSIAPYIFFKWYM